MMQQTREVAAIFLKDPQHPHTFVVTVASAKDSRIRNSQAMQLVQEHNKERMAIGVLTHADCTEDRRDDVEDPFARLKELTNGEAEDLPAFEHGYVVLMNRDTMMPSQTSLEGINELERTWFATCRTVVEIAALMPSPQNWSSCLNHTQRTRGTYWNVPDLLMNEEN